MVKSAWQQMVRLALVAVCAGALAACGVSSGVSEAQFTRTGEIIAFGGGEGRSANACFSCHGREGEGDGHLVPRLAGLDAGYLRRQLDDYASGRRRHDAMAQVAGKLAPASREKVARYYASLSGPGFTDDGNSKSPTHGIYHNGDSRRGLAPCAICHGKHGEGQGAAVPPLGTQPAAFLAEQLRSWQRGGRQNDPGHVMLKLSRKLSEAEIVSVSAFAASLSGAYPRPRPAASPPARRDDPRNDVSGPRPHAPR